MKKTRTFRNSEEFLNICQQLIPLGSQTFSKSKTQYPVGISPLYASKAKGSKIWDIDGNRYFDLVNALAAITLGYGNKEVNKAVIRQVKKGSIYSLPDKIEFRVAELIKEIIPSIEMIRFGKNASDATSAAIRVARAYTGRKLIAVCGYHGWQDWYIATTSRNKGIPNEIGDMSKKFIFNDIESLNNLFEEFKNQIAAVILEPFSSQLPKDDFLEKVINITKINGAISIFDETITGFRVSRNGAQGLYRVNPDLSVFGKGIANGYPLSVLGGKAEIMKEMEEIFFSTTFGGETVSLAAAEAVCKLIIKEDFTIELEKKGKYLADGINKIIQEMQLEPYLELTGHNSWKFLNWKHTDLYNEPEIKTYFLQEMFQKGILVLSSHNISCAYSYKDIDKVIGKYHEFLTEFSSSLKNESISKKLRVEPLIPLFRVR